MWITLFGVMGLTLCQGYNHFVDVTKMILYWRLTSIQKEVPNAKTSTP